MDVNAKTDCEVGKVKYLKWKNDVIAEINSDYSVDFLTEQGALFTNPDSLITHWSREQFKAFLDDRIVSSQRRDIEYILFQYGLNTYNTFRIAEITKAINARDLLWVSDNAYDSFADAVTDVFESVFIKKIDMVGDSINTPDGCNVKRYGVYNNKYGIYKNRLHPLSTDVESEVAVYKLAKRLGVPCCKAVQTDENTVFSEFEYDFAAEQIIHFRRLFETDEKRSANELTNLLNKRPAFKNDFYKMIFLDFLTLQNDRHLSNFAIKINSKTRQESFYPLYDNGRSLFYQDTEETIERTCQNPAEYCTTFGTEGSYYDHITDILSAEPEAIGLIDLSVTEEELYQIMKESGFKGKNLDGAVKWVSNGIKCIQDLSMELKQGMNNGGISGMNI